MKGSMMSDRVEFTSSGDEISLGEWVDDGSYSHWEVMRTGNEIDLSFDSVDGPTRVLSFSPEDASSIGMALVQAASTPEETQ